MRNEFFQIENLEMLYGYKILDLNFKTFFKLAHKVLGYIFFKYLKYFNTFNIISLFLNLYL